MAKDNSWKTVAEVYRNREHQLIADLQKLIDGRTKSDNVDKTLVLLTVLVADHLKRTGRDINKTPTVPEISSPVAEAKSELLALLGATQGQAGPVRTSTRKVRSDKGKKRGSYKDKVKA